MLIEEDTVTITTHFTGLRRSAPLAVAAALLLRGLGVDIDVDH